MKEVGIKNMTEAGDAIIIAIAGFLKKQGWSYFVAHWKAFLDGIKDDNQIPAEWIDLDPVEEASLAEHWTQTMYDHGIGGEHAQFLIGKIMNMLKDAFDIYNHFHPVTV
jgi:hypothetical protein